MHDIRFIRDNPDAFDKALARRGLAAAGAAADRARRAAPSENPRARNRASAAQRGVEGNRRGEEEQGRGESQGIAERGCRAEGIDSGDGGGGERRPPRRWTTRWRKSPTAARRMRQPARRSARRQGREGQRRASSFRRETRLCVRAEAAFRSRRSARPDGFRNRGETLRRALCGFEERAWRGSNARSVNSCSMCTRASRTITPRLRRHFWCATR